MKCLRCEGLMTEERVITEEGEITMARCIYCGDLIDGVVLFNRRHSASRWPPKKSPAWRELLRSGCAA